MNDNTTLVSFVILVLLSIFLCNGKPDIIDGIIYRLHYGNVPSMTVGK